MKEPMCSVCGGEGSPLSGKPCICGGTGSAIDEMIGLRRHCNSLTTKLAEAEERERRLREALQAMRSAMHDEVSGAPGAAERAVKADAMALEALSPPAKTGGGT